MQLHLDWKNKFKNKSHFFLVQLLRRSLLTLSPRTGKAAPGPSPCVSKSQVLCCLIGFIPQTLGALCQPGSLKSFLSKHSWADLRKKEKKWKMSLYLRVLLTLISLSCTVLPKVGFVPGKGALGQLGMRFPKKLIGVTSMELCGYS